jgi:hypothetical protein
MVIDGRIDNQFQHSWPDHARRAQAQPLKRPFFRVLVLALQGKPEQYGHFGEVRQPMEFFLAA